MLITSLQPCPFYCIQVALLLGVEVYEGVSFDGLLEPEKADDPDGRLDGWRARVTPADHPVAHFQFNALIGADGKRNTLQGFRRKEFRGKLAIAITVNFINRHSEAESHVEEISGVAFIFNQKFFNDLNEAKGILLENIVYYKVRQSLQNAVQAMISILAERLLLFLQHGDAQKD